MKLDEYLKLIPMPNPVGLALNNYKMTTVGKLFFASLLTSMATGQKSPFKVTGDPHKIEVLSKASVLRLYLPLWNVPFAADRTVIFRTTLTALITTHFLTSFPLLIPKNTVI